MLTAVSVFAAASIGWANADATPVVPLISAPVTVDPSASGALSLVAVSCVSAGNCTAVGRLADPSTSTYSPAAVSEISGTWGSPVLITLPAGSYASGTLNGLTSIQCFSAGTCEAVGRFENSAAGTTTALVTSESGGVWSSASAIGQPANGSSGVSAWLTSLSCTSVGSCAAVGTYYDSQDQVEPMVVTEADGTWSAPSELPVATGFTPEQGLWSISCVTATCAAAGPIANGGNDVAGVASEAGGTWSSAAPVSSAPGTAIYGVSCTAGGCVAVGDESTTSTSIPALFIEKGGDWTEESVKAGPTSSTSALLWAVDCTSWGNCDAVGDTSAGTGVFALAEEDGTWTPSLSVPVDDNSATIVEITGLSCTSALGCEAVGRVGTDSVVNSVAWASHAPSLRHTIVCKRGHHVRRVSGVAPRCPSGFLRT